MADPYGKTTLQSGFRLFDGSAIGALISKVFEGGLTRQNGITATPGGTKAAAYPLKNSLNRISVCASANDSVLLPKAIRGSMVVLTNSGAQTLAVFGKGTDTIDGVATATANTIATTKSKIFACYSTGFWHTVSAVA